MHRDIKPANMILAPQRLRFLLVDLGAAVDLRTGTNYKPDEALLDPAFCPPEQVGGAAHGPLGQHTQHVALSWDVPGSYAVDLHARVHACLHGSMVDPWLKHQAGGESLAGPQHMQLPAY